MDSEVSRTELEGAWAQQPIRGWVRTLSGWLALEGREWTGTFEGRTIRVMNRGLLRTELWVDETCVDRRSPFLARSGKVPLLSARMPLAGHGVTLVEVFSRAWLAREIKVSVAAKPIRMTRVETRAA